jgi:type VI secretion system protein VasI
MFKTIAIAAIFFSLGSAGFGANLGDECIQLSDNELRLACFDRTYSIASKPAPIEQTAELKTTGAWVVSTDSSPIDDSKTVTLHLQSNSDIRGRFGAPGPMDMFVRCKENTTSIFFVFNGLFMSDHQHGRVTYRIDDLKAQIVQTSESTDHQALGLWNGGRSIPMIKKMLGHDRLIVRATPLSESPVTGEFNISEVENAVETLRTTCNW